MTVLSEELRIARAYAEADMKSTCTITRAGDGERVWTEATGTYTDPPRQTVYSGRCKVQDSARRAVGTAEAGEVTAAIDSLELHLPIDGSGAVRRNDVARIETNPDDPALVGREFVVRAPHAATMKTARRLPVEAVL